MSEIYAPGSIAGPQGPAGAAGSAAAVSALSGALVPSFVGRNLFEFAKVTPSTQVNAADGTLTTGSGQPTDATALIYCPGATSMIANLAINGSNWGGGVCCYDANGNFLSALSATVGNGVAFALPGTQTYIRFGYVSSWMAAGFAQSTGMIVAAVTGTAALPAAYQPAGLDTVADVNTKDAAVSATAAAALAASLTGAVELALKSALPFPPGGSANMFDAGRVLANQVLHSDGTTASSAGMAVATIYAPAATEFITNLPIRGLPNGYGICLYDANGNFLADISASLPYSGPFVSSNAVQPLPGTQTYIKFTYSTGDLLGLSGGPINAMFFAGSSTDPCPAALPYGLLFPGKGSLTVKTASQLGCMFITDVMTGVSSSYLSVPFDNAPLLNAFLATASETSPVKLILDGPCAVSGLVLSANGYTTIEGIGPGSGIFVINGSNQDGIRIGPYTTATGQSEGAYNIAAPARSAANIVLRDFTLNANASSNVTAGGSSTAVNAPVAGAPAHCVFGAIFANCSGVLVENVNFPEAPAFALTFSNANLITVRGCRFTSTGVMHDGVHIDGKCEDIVISDCYFATGDDAIALNAPEGYGGDISRVTVTNCIFDNSLTAMRIYTSLDAAAMPSNNVHTVRNVAMSNCAGTTTTQCFNLGITNGGLSATSNADQLQDLSVTNCTLSSPLGLATLLTTFGSLTFSDVRFIPMSSAPLFTCLFSSVGELVARGVRILRNPDGNAAPASIVYVYSAVAMDRVTLLDFAVVDEEGSSYAALPCLIDNSGSIAALRLEAVDMAHIAALVSGSGWSGVAAVRGGGVLGTGMQVPDSAMDSSALYLSSSAGGALSIKISGTAKRLTLA